MKTQNGARNETRFESSALPPSLCACSDELETGLWASWKALGKGEPGQLHCPSGPQTRPLIRTSQNWLILRPEGFSSKTFVEEISLPRKTFTESPALSTVVTAQPRLPSKHRLPTLLLLPITCMGLAQGFLSQSWNYMQWFLNGHLVIGHTCLFFKESWSPWNFESYDHWLERS